MIADGKENASLQAAARESARRIRQGPANGERGTRRRLLGFTEREALGVVLSLTDLDFHKSMTTYADHTIWQDVYRPFTVRGDVYLKLTVIDDVLIVSFKER